MVFRSLALIIRKLHIQKIFLKIDGFFTPLQLLVRVATMILHEEPEAQVV